jgi:hypothetical protein
MLADGTFESGGEMWTTVGQADSVVVSGAGKDGIGKALRITSTFSMTGRQQQWIPV